MPGSLGCGVGVYTNLNHKFTHKSRIKHQLWKKEVLLDLFKTMLTKCKKDNIIKKFKTHSLDTGSPEVQIAILTTEIKELISHLKKHKHDFSSRRGLLKKVGRRRRLLIYLEQENPESYEKLIKKLKLKKIEEPEEEKQTNRVSIN